AQSLERPLTRGILARTWISEPGESHRDKHAEPQSPQASATVRAEAKLRNPFALKKIPSGFWLSRRSAERIKTGGHRRNFPSHSEQISYQARVALEATAFDWGEPRPPRAGSDRNYEINGSGMCQGNGTFDAKRRDWLRGSLMRISLLRSHGVRKIRRAPGQRRLPADKDPALSRQPTPYTRPSQIPLIQWPSCSNRA